MNRHHARELKHTLVMALLMVATSGSGQSTFTSCSAETSKIGFEDEIQLAVTGEGYLINEKEMRRREKILSRGIKWPGRNPSEKASLAMSHIVDLYRQTQRVLTSKCAQDECVTGIWIYLGHDQSKLKYYYRPGVLKKIAGSRADRPVFDTLAFGSSYEYGSQGFSVASLTNDVSNYQARLRVRHRRASLFYSEGKFDTDANEGDARKIFYTFQEIIKYYDSLSNETGPRYYCGSIYLNNAGEYFSSGSSSDKRKHTLFITHSLGSKEALSALSNYGADLAHVCPSVCNELSYPSEQLLLEFKSRKKKKR